MERHELLVASEKHPEENLFYSGPCEFLIKVIVQELCKVSQFKDLFAESIDCYKRMDYSVRELPGMRIYTDRYTKEFESWFIEGDVKLDIIFPASLRRDELQSYQMTIASAILQQFRRESFYEAVEERVPGLNQLGRRVDVDMSLGFEWQDEIVPLTQITLNFKVDLRMWDDFLTKTNRTKDEPFCETIVDLRRIVSTIQGLKELDENLGCSEIIDKSDEPEVEVKVDQRVD